MSFQLPQILDPFVVTIQGAGAAGKCCDATGRRFRHFSLGVDLDSRVIIRTCASRSRGIPFDTVPDISKVLSQCAEEMVQTTSARELVATCAGCHVRHAVIPSGTWDLEESPTVLLLRLRDIESFNAVNVESSVMFGGTKYVLSCALALDPRGVSSCFLRNAVDGTWSGLVSGGVVREYGTWEGVLSIVGGTGARRAMNCRYSPWILCYQAEGSCGRVVQPAVVAPAVVAPAGAGAGGSDGRVIPSDAILHKPCGIVNIGSTCYFATATQCLAQIALLGPWLEDRLSSMSTGQAERGHQMELFNFLFQAWTSRRLPSTASTIRPPADPSELLDNHNFAPGLQHDAHEALLALILQLGCDTRIDWVSGSMRRALFFLIRKEYDCTCAHHSGEKCVNTMGMESTLGLDIPATYAPNIASPRTMEEVRHLCHPYVAQSLADVYPVCLSPTQLDAGVLWLQVIHAYFNDPEEHRRRVKMCDTCHCGAPEGSQHGTCVSHSTIEYVPEYVIVSFSLFAIQTTAFRGESRGRFAARKVRV